MDSSDIYDDIKQSMKEIVEQTNTILKHSFRAYKKIKEKTLVLDDVKLCPSESTKEWFSQRKIETITIPEFFNLVFQEAAKENRLDFTLKTIEFNDYDAKVFNFVSNTKIHIIDFFEKLPEYFE